jgi:hypothetical protein|tara:strand:+ start:42 stop:506 length:465 start_codon:yes stop_codon:yes gene_type:complete
MIYFLYRLTNSTRQDKCGATISWDKRCRDNREFHGEQSIITELETMEGPNTPEMWQVVGDREWELADQYGYPRGEHYRSAREKRRVANQKGAALGGSAGKGKPNTHLRSFTNDKVIEIKSKYVPYKYTVKKLAEEYSVHPMTIWNILNNKYYQA